MRGERAQALLEAQKTNTVAQTNKLFDRRLANLNQEYALQKAQLQIEINRSQLEKKLAATQRQEDIQNAVDPIREQQARVELNTAGLSMPSAELERQQLALDQIYRLRQAELPILREINRLDTEINSLALSDEVKADKNLALVAQKEKLNAVRQELDLLNQLEQKQLNRKQVLAQLQMEKDLYESISTTIATTFSSGINAAVAGTENLGEALKKLGTDLLATIGNMLIMYGIAQALGALGADAGKPQGIFSFLAKGFGFKGAKEGAYWPGGFQAFADGGVVTRPTMGLIGEGGEPEYVIPASKMRGAMSRYASGARGSAVIPAGGDTGEVGASTAGGIATVDVRYTVERINSVDYVTTEQFQKGMQDATRQGAALGQRQVYSDLANKRSLRQRLAL